MGIPIPKVDSFSYLGKRRYLAGGEGAGRDVKKCTDIRLF
jgi:hypothetical protein